MDMVSDGNDGNLAILQVTSNQKGDVAGASAKGVHALGRVSPMAHTSQEDQSPLKPHQTWMLLHGTVMEEGPAQHILVLSVDCCPACPLVPGALRMGAAEPPQHWQMASLSCSFACVRVPWTWRSLAAKELQHMQMTSSSCASTRPLVPVARRRLAAKPFQHRQMPSRRCSGAGDGVPRAWWLLGSEPPQNFKVASSSSCYACPRAPVARG